MGAIVVRVADAPEDVGVPLWGSKLCVGSRKEAIARLNTYKYS
ncbi:MAG: hypothetical protein V7K48_31230 [Nostoc sp.]